MRTEIKGEVGEGRTRVTGSGRGSTRSGGGTPQGEAPGGEEGGGESEEQSREAQRPQPSGTIEDSAHGSEGLEAQRKSQPSSTDRPLRQG